MIDLNVLTIASARKKLDAKEFSAVELAEAYLSEINKKNKELNAYLEVYDDVLDQARIADEIIKRGETYPLLGIPLAIKDVILIKGKKVSAASKILENYVASYDATVISKLKKQGAVFLGRTNTDEFALGSSTENSAYGVTRNPHDTVRVSGGTSGGSACAVASSMALGALGSDTGGSIRQPSAFCGVIGFKPTYGRVSRYGLMAATSSFYCVGPIANNFKEMVKNLESLGFEIKDIKLPNCLALYYIINFAEVSTNLARFDGVRYGLHIDGKNLLEDYFLSKGKGFGKESRRRILLGTYVLSAGYYDAYYGKAQKARVALRTEFTKVFSEVDLILTPTAPGPAWKIGEKSDPLSMYLEDIFTVTANIVGVPAVSIPSGFTEVEGKKLPLGIQFMASHGAEESLFEVGKKFESIKNKN